MRDTTHHDGRGEGGGTVYKVRWKGDPLLYSFTICSMYQRGMYSAGKFTSGTLMKQASLPSILSSDMPLPN